MLSIICHLFCPWHVVFTKSSGNCPRNWPNKYNVMLWQTNSVCAFLPFFLTSIPISYEISRTFIDFQMFFGKPVNNFSFWMLLQFGKQKLLLSGFMENYVCGRLHKPVLLYPRFAIMKSHENKIISILSADVHLTTLLTI